MDQNTFTEEEAIKITIQNGYDGSEFNTAVWNDRGCLTPNRTMYALISKLEAIYHNVNVEGKGKKRKYILTDKKEEMTERKFKYKGTVPTDDDLIMGEFIFNQLAMKARGANTYKKWGEEFNLLQPKTFSNEALIDVMKEIHMGLYFNPKEIVSEFINAITNHNYALVNNSFNRLEREGRIIRSSVYIFVTIEGNHEKVSKAEYDNAQAFKKDLVESHGIEYRQYILSKRSLHKSNKMKEIIDKVDDRMAKEFRIYNMYKMVEVSIEDKQEKREVSREEFDQAYFRKFIKLSKDRQNRTDYQETKSFWRRTYLLNTLTLLSIIPKGTSEIIGLEELLSKEKKRISGEGFYDYEDDEDVEVESEYPSGF